MSRSWNGEALVNELSALLGDSSTVFKTRVLGWLNDTIFDMSSRHDWGHHLTKGKKYLSTGSELHSLEIAYPAAPNVALTAGGALTAGSTYSFLVTYLQDNGVESALGVLSNKLTTTAEFLSIKLTGIPTSAESLVTKRNIYMSVDDGAYYFHSQIADNFETDLIISTNAGSLIEPPDYAAIRRLNGSPFFESSPSNYLQYRDIDQLRQLIQGKWSLGSPEYFSPIESNTIATYPLPSSDFELSFNYYRNPFRLYFSKSSQPDLPVYLKPALKAGVIALGYEYRDRAGQEFKKANYENALVDAINRGGRVANIEYVVRDVYGTPNGFEVG
jgi:hypothetical protein